MNWHLLWGMTAIAGWAYTGSVAFQHARDLLYKYNYGGKDERVLFKGKVYALLALPCWGLSLLILLDILFRSN